MISLKTNELGIMDKAEPKEGYKKGFRIYPQNNYLVIQSEDKLHYFFPQNASTFYVTNNSIIITTTAKINSAKSVTIDLNSIGDYYNESGTIPYDYETLIDLLTFYTSKI